ncbi:hypothetical protein ILYODFUR_033710 [Ilyodon furcidens]|uniref:Uncharacterized protein n=1 Tax=Ilyodon furcidens TaxID=33524 RepID=A0ABV0TQQ5_9TELE
MNLSNSLFKTTTRLHGVNYRPSARRCLCEQCKLDLLMNVFSHRIQVQSNYAIYAHLASLFTIPVCQAFRVNENIHGQNHAWHPLLTSCRNTAKHDCYAAGNAENPRALANQRSRTFTVIRIISGWYRSKFIQQQFV